MAINEQTYHPLRTNSLVWAKDLATLLGVGANGRELRPVGSSRNTGGNWAEMRPDGSLHYGSTAETTLTTREIIQPSMNSVRFARFGRFGFALV